MDVDQQADGPAATTGTVDQAELQKRIADHREKKRQMLAEEEKRHFSYDQKSKATPEEEAANAKLTQMKKQLVTPLYNIVIHDFYKVKERLEKTQLYEVLSKMPKGGLHHVHTTAAPHVDVFLELTYEKETYYNEREGLFKVYNDHHLKEDGFVACTEMRAFYADPKDYDENLKKQIMLTSAEQAGLESHDIWGFFQHKFSRIGGLAKYQPFFERLLRSNIEACIEQNIYIVELRHTTGCLKDKDQKGLSLLDELAMIQGIIDDVKTRTPHFELKLILTSYKMVGQAHCSKILEHIKIGKERYPDLISGYDAVNEEEYTDELESFMPQVLGAQNTPGITHNMPCFFHAGETHDRSIKNIYDAVLLKSKRIGHGFQLSLFPNLLQEVIKRDICVEACPLSNMVLGYTLDLRNHPVRYMMHQGLQVSISSDDPGFFHYSGVTLDFIYVTLAWELDIWDLKKLCINGIKYSSIEEEKKQNLLENVFPADWAAFVAKLSNLEVQEAVTEVAPQ